jgi:signal transduction histidine kinase
VRNHSECESHAATLTLADAGRNRLIAIFGHELRSHIAPIKNASELLQRGALTPSTARKLADIVGRQIDEINRLVDGLLVSTRSPESHPLLERTETAVQMIVERALETVEPLVAGRRHALVVRMPAEPIRIAGDEFWLAHALQNVIGNAAKYTDPGGRIEVDVTHALGDILISVSDTGVGLAPLQRDTVFALYNQIAQPATRPAAGGLGVGLHVAEFVVKAHGGSIRANSEGLGRGSRFVIRLPCRVVEQPVAP